MSYANSEIQTDLTSFWLKLRFRWIKLRNIMQSFLKNIMNSLKAIIKALFGCTIRQFLKDFVKNYLLKFLWILQVFLWKTKNVKKINRVLNPLFSLIKQKVAPNFPLKYLIATLLAWLWFIHWKTVAQAIVNKIKRGSLLNYQALDLDFSTILREFQRRGPEPTKPKCVKNL